MNLKTTVPLAVAVVLGLVAAIVASQLVKQRPVAVAGPGQNVMHLTGVVVASREITPGAALVSEDLSIIRIESAAAPANVATSPAALVNRVAKVQIPAGQMIHESLLAERGVSGGLPGVIAPGMRAMTIEINEFTGLAGLLEPGNRIDILARVTEVEGGPQMSRTIVQNVPIIAVGAQLTKSAATPVPPPGAAAEGIAPAKAPARSVTVLVTPADAEKIDLASASNSARVVLRASNDDAMSNAGGATLASLRGAASNSTSKLETASAQKTPVEKPRIDDIFGERSAPTASRKQPGRTVTVVRAGVQTEVDVSSAPAPDTTSGGQASVAE